jgi:hypothetical protein
MPARYTSERFVGRDDAFMKLASLLQSASAGEAGALLIDGTAGIGASRFIDETVRRVAALHEPMLLIRGGAYGPGTDRPYAPVIRALRPVLAGLPDPDLEAVVGSAADELARLLPELAARIGGQTDEGRRRFTTVAERRQARPTPGPARSCRSWRGSPGRSDSPSWAHTRGMRSAATTLGPSIFVRLNVPPARRSTSHLALSAVTTSPG